MGQLSSKRIVLLIVCMALAGILVLFKPVSHTQHKQTKLASALTSFNGWERDNVSKLDQPIIDALDLDDYINQSYSDGEDTIMLYVGYYYSAKKIGAAHDPMVCFPGQGWKISNSQTNQRVLASGQRVSYSVMTGELGQQKELITYWFQAHDKTNANTFSQKIALLWKKLRGQGEDNAFVRITIPIGSKPIKYYNDKTFQFIEAFYPVFHEFIIK